MVINTGCSSTFVKSGNVSPHLWASHIKRGRKDETPTDKNPACDFQEKPVTDGQTHNCIIATVIAQPAELLYWHQNKHLNTSKLKQLDTANGKST